MADIDIKGLYAQKQREFNTEGGGSSRFESDFVDAVNRTIRRINRKADLESPATGITSTQDDISDLDEAYEDVLSTGVSLELLRMGQRPAPGSEGQPAVLQEQFEEGISQIYFKLKNDIQDSNADGDTETDIIGLGYLG